MEPFNPYNHFGFLTHRIARLIDALAGQYIIDMGYSFPPSCIGIMADLWKKDGQSQKELGKSLIKNKSSINKMLEALEKDGMIIKRTDGSDKRKKQIFLTDTGIQFRTAIESIGRQTEDSLLQGLPSEDILLTKKTLATLYEKLAWYLSEQNCSPTQNTY